MQPIEVIDDEDEMRLDRWFTLRFPSLSHGQLQRLLRSGQIRLDGRRIKSGERVRAGQSVRVPPFLKAEDAPEKSGILSNAEQKWLEDMCVFQDNDLVVLNKPQGLAVQGGEGIRRSLDDLVRGWSTILYGKETSRGLRLVHRLDQETTGLIVLAHGRKTAAQLSRSFASRQVEKNYLALVAGTPAQDDGEIRAPLIKAQLPDGGERMTVDKEEGRPAITEFEVVDRAGSRAALLRLAPKTGRTHQLRVHCAAVLKCPIIGDHKYSTTHGGKAPNLNIVDQVAGLHLHSWRLSFLHPTSHKRLHFEAKLPDHMKQSLDFMGLRVHEKHGV